MTRRTPLVVVLETAFDGLLITGSDCLGSKETIAVHQHKHCSAWLGKANDADSQVSGLVSPSDTSTKYWPQDGHGLIAPSSTS